MCIQVMSKVRLYFLLCNRTISRFCLLWIQSVITFFLHCNKDMLQLAKVEQRAILSNLKKQLAKSRQCCLNDYRVKIINLMTSFEWYNRFKNGRDNIEEEKDNVSPK